MGKLRTTWKKNPGFVVACAGHALLFVFLVADFARPVTVTDPTDSVSVEMVTTSQLDQIMQGEKTAKPADKPLRRVDKVADLEDHKAAPPLAEAKKDTPPPPAPDKANDDPGEDTKPPQPVAAVPPPRPPEPVTPPAPMPPERPLEKTETKPTPAPPPKPEAVKEQPSPPDAEALAPKPPPRPKIEPKIVRNEPAPEAKPVPRPPAKEAQQEPRPEPPKRPDPPKHPDPPKKDTKPTLDQVAKLLDSMKPPKPVVKARSGNDTKEAKPRSDFNPDQISAMLSHEAPQRKASTGRQLAQLASLGAPTGHASQMSLSMRGDLDNWLKDHYLGCWHYFGLGATQDYVPQVKVKMAPDGSLIGEPILINQPPDANLRSLADSAIRAVHTCNPLAIPDRFKPYYDSWRSQTIRFDPKELS